MKLYPHQEDALKWLDGRDKTIAALDQGLGKTIIAAKTILTGERVLVIVPASLKLNWKKELEIWGPKDMSIHITKKKSETLPDGPGIIIMNYDLLGYKLKKTAKSKGVARPNFDFSNFDRVILDEAHFIKNVTSIRSKIAGKIVYKTPKALLLTGTPMNRPIDLYVPLFSIGAIDDKYHSFGMRYCDAQQIYLGRRQVWQYRGLTNERELRSILKPFMLRMKKEDVIDLPERLTKVVALDLPVSRQEKSYSFTDISKDPRPLAFEGLAELIHDQGLIKLPLAISHIKMRLETEEKVFVVARHADVIDTLMEKLKEFNPVKLDGRCSMLEKNVSVEEFQKNPECRVFVGQIKAAGVGITLTAASHVIIVEAEWDYSALMQVIDRCHRIGQKNTVTAEILTIDGSIDERMLWTTLTKKDYSERVVENKEKK